MSGKPFEKELKLDDIPANIKEEENISQKTQHSRENTSDFPNHRARSRRKCNLQIGFCYVSPHHPVTVEVVCNFSYGVFHHVNPIVSFSIERWYDQILELVVQVFLFPNSSFIFFHVFLWRWTYSPTCHTFDAAFYPPAV